MKNVITKPKHIDIICGGKEVPLTILPLTFMRLIDINSALGDKDINDVLCQPKPMDLSKIAYCLLDDKSKQIIDSIDIVISDQAVKTNTLHKLFYLLCENTVLDGVHNYTILLTAIVEIMNESCNVPPSKKKARLWNLFRWISKKFTTKSGQTIHINIPNF